MPWLAATGFVVGPIVPYVPQLRIMRTRGDSQGFSPLVSLLLIVGAIGRVFYWYTCTIHRSGVGQLLQAKPHLQELQSTYALLQ